MEKQITLFKSGNELAALAASQINYHVMGYYPITPSTQVSENLDQMRAKNECDTLMIEAEGEHSAAGLCYGASLTGARVLNATSANGLLYSIEQLPVQSGTRSPMVLNVACRSVSGPLSIKGDHSDIMYALNTGWIILFADDAQKVYDMNLCAIKIAERAKLPVIVGYDGFFTSHQKKRVEVFEEKAAVARFIGSCQPDYPILDVENPTTVGAYMNEPDFINNKVQLCLAMEEAKEAIDEIFDEYESFCGRKLKKSDGFSCDDAEVIMFALGASYITVKEAVKKLRKQGIKAGAFTVYVLRPSILDEIQKYCGNAKKVLILDRQVSYGAEGGNMSLEIKAALQKLNHPVEILTRIYGLGGKDFFEEDAIRFFEEAMQGNARPFDFIGKHEGKTDHSFVKYFEPVTMKDSDLPSLQVEYDAKAGCYQVKGLNMNETCGKKKRMVPGHGACPGCGLFVNLNLLLRAIKGNVVLLFQTGCSMVVSAPYPFTSYRVPFVHNLFQNGAATLSGIIAGYHQLQKRNQISTDPITFIMVSGDGGMDIGMGCAIAAALRNEHFILLELDNGGYMNTGYQYSYTTPLGAKSSTSHLGKGQNGKPFLHKDTCMIMAACNIPYVVSAAESQPLDFMRKAAKAQKIASEEGFVYFKTLSACPLNWNDDPSSEVQVIQSAVESCYFPLFEIEKGKVTINYDPKEKVPVMEYLKRMGRTRHLCDEKYQGIVQEIQNEVDKRWERLKKLETL